MEKKKKIFNLFIVILILCSFMSFFIVPADALSKVKLNKTKTTLYVGQSTTLKLSGAKVKKWKSNDKNIATVNKNGKVVAKKKGTTTIVATTKNGKTYKCKVTVKNVSLNKTKVTLEKGKSVTLKLNGSKVTKWSSDNKKIATVNSKGKVVAKEVGITTIKAKAKNGKIYKCKVVVSKKENKKDFYPDTSNYSEEEKQILSIFETTLRNAGFSKTTDIMTKEEIEMFGPDIGMGWGEGHCTLDSVVAETENMISFMSTRGYNVFYIEILGTSNGETTIKFYRGTF